VLAPATYTLDQIQRLFGYLKAVLEADLRPENLSLTPDVEELARQALALPAEQRTLFQIVKNLRVGVYKARLIKVVEEAGSAVHAPLPSLDLGAYSPEFRGGESGEAPATGDQLFEPDAGAPGAPGGVAAAAAYSAGGDWAAAPSAPAAAAGGGHAPASAAAAGVARCVGCGGIASVVHSCSAPLCQHCIGQFPNCPKCGLSISTASTRPLDGVLVQSTVPRPSSRASAALGGLKGVFTRSKPVPSRSEAPATKPGTVRTEHAGKPAHPGTEKTSSPPAAKGATAHHDGGVSPADKEAKPTARTIPEPPLPPSPTAPRPRREKRDDEPRL